MTKTEISASGVLALAGVLGVGLLAFTLYQKRKAIASAVNPLSDKNLAYQGANAVVQAITGNKIDSVGTAIANKLPSKAESAVDAMLRAPASAPKLPAYSTPPLVPSTSDGTFTGWLSSMFKSDAEKAVDAQYMRGIGGARFRDY